MFLKPFTLVDAQLSTYLNINIYRNETKNQKKNLYIQLTNFGNTVLCCIFPLASVICAKLVLSFEAEFDVGGNLEIEVIAPVPSVILFTVVFSPVGGFGKRLLSHGWRRA